MEDFKADEPKLYEELPKERQRALYKEYYTFINPHAKIWRLISVFFFLAALLTSVSVFYCLIKLLFMQEAIIWTWLISLFFMPLAFISFTIKQWVNDCFLKWLWSKKDILSKDWPKKNKVNAETSKSKLKIFKELPKDKKRKLFKEFFSINRAAKYSFWVAIICLVVTLADAGIMIYYFTKGFFIGELALIVSSGCGAFLFNYSFIKNQFWKWLEYEKKIIKKWPKTIDKEVMNKSSL